ncbi:MAG: hypothetical protein PQJ59_07415 [Spirochaetales bacterium]|nr:hypothetical protein [Spirochaetales bacterium]
MARFTDKIKAFHIGDFVNMKAFLLMLVGFLFLSLVISFAIIFVTLRNRQIVEAQVAEQSSFVDALDSSLDVLRTGDFVFPEQDDFRQTQPHMQREPQDSWSEEEVERYWIDPSDTGIGEISEYNRALVEEMLEDVP